LTTQEEIGKRKKRNSNDRVYYVLESC